VIALGRNNLNGDGTAKWDATTDTKYKAIATEALACGFGSVICRTIYRESNGLTHPATPKIVAAQAALNNPAVKLANVDGFTRPDCTGDDANGFIHPNTAGYASMAAQETPLYGTLLGRTPIA
jgi:hypothetical protein